MAVDYANWIRDELAAKPLDRAVLAGFAELVQAAGVGPVADVGCGPGRVTAHLHGLGLSVFGVDPSPQMVAVARQAHPGLRFDVGSMLALHLPDGVLGGIVAWYSIIHVPQERLPEVFAEFHRVLAPGGHLLLLSPAETRTPRPWTQPGPLPLRVSPPLPRLVSGVLADVEVLNIATLGRPEVAGPPADVDFVGAADVDERGNDLTAQIEEAARRVPGRPDRLGGTPVEHRDTYQLEVASELPRGSPAAPPSR